MDILTHTLSGVAVAGAVAALSNKPLSKKAVLLCCGAMGAILPDIDTITLWSRFDAVIGTCLDMPAHGSSIYFGNYWYSHHNWTHSLAAGALGILMIGLIAYIGRCFFAKTSSLSSFARTQAGYLLVFFLGYSMHLLGDLPTPGHTWRGIKLFWPMVVPVGGTGHLWWWNNYDIFILFAVCCLTTLVLLMWGHIRKKPILRYLPSIVLAVTMMLTLYQVHQRPVRFNDTGYAENERQSLNIQNQILGEPLYKIMVAVDQRLRFNF